MGGGVTTTALRAGLLDEVILHQVPVLLGAGRRFFGELPAHIGLSLVERWIPGQGKHSTGHSADHTRRGYFPILAATGHVMAASTTVILVVIALLRGFR